MQPIQSFNSIVVRLKAHRADSLGGHGDVVSIP